MNGSEILEAARSYEESSQAEVEQQDVLEFSLDKERYGIDIENVTEVIRCPRIFNIPCTPDHIVGVINLRGEILTIIDVRKLLGLTAPEPSDQKYAVVVERHGIKIGIIVDKASELVSIPDSAIEPSLSDSDNTAHLIAGEVQLGGEVLAILNIDQLLKTPEEP